VEPLPDFVRRSPALLYEYVVAPVGGDVHVAVVLAVQHSCPSVLYS
jgi:hypothetical protein